MTKDESIQHAKVLQDKIFISYNLAQHLGGDPNSVKLPRNGDWLGWLADALYSAALPEESRCPRPINTATDFSKEWCQKNGHCGCKHIEDLREQYGEALYPPNGNDGTGE